MSTAILYAVAAAALGISFWKDRERTMAALKKGWLAFDRILPQFITIVLGVGLILAFLSPQAIGRIIGQESGWLGVLLASLVGAVTLVPGFIAFPTAALLVHNGAGYTQIAAFVSSLMMVGVMTFGVERGYFGTRVALMRNATAYIFSLIVALIVGAVVAL